MAYKPSDKRKQPPSTIEPDVTPIMNLMVVLIPLLLSVAEFVKLALLEYSPPPIEDIGAQGEGEGGGEGGEEQTNLNLMLNITENEFQVSVFGATKEGENFKKIPKVGEGPFEYDYDGLHEELVRIRKEVIGEPIGEQEEGVDPETGLPIIGYTWKYNDAETMRITAKGDIPWQVVVGCLDASRDYVDEKGEEKPLFGNPVMGQVQ